MSPEYQGQSKLSSPVQNVGINTPPPLRHFKRQPLNIEIPFSVNIDVRVGQMSRDILRSPTLETEKFHHLPKLTPKIAYIDTHPNVRFESPKRILKTGFKCYNQPTYRTILSPEKVVSRYVGFNKTKEMLKMPVKGHAKGPTYGGFYLDDNPLLRYIDRLDRNL